MTDDYGETLDALSSPLGQMVVVAVITAGFALGGIVTPGPAGTAFLVFALIVVLLGSYRVLSVPSPPERFEVGTYRAGHQYHGVTITAKVEICYNEAEIKLRTVECAAVAEDGTTIVRESDTEPVGTKPYLYGLVGGADSVRSTTDHILAVSTPVHEYIDKWLAAEGNDPAIKATLETEFATTDSEMEQAREEN